ncbi:NAD-dependent succinate-semialdehyde dehydrogenase [Methylocella silvestris]|uniref:NAD-dependent succinate-semialdehyde dehydrogenase n=1 Tax=Methylocella silvestris TaxID=199596 RepID=A0A2J7TKT2_METSI|nr:NAD-dependent succinate-semialdehyde dehydrogenase [Methylocella silvestris]PNG27382.1 NAD-dependent succinate-semialdehyde dehydrogenase [Methylocella silvestris]
MYSDVLLHIAGKWRPAENQRCLPVTNPATAEKIGAVACASQNDLDEALAASARGFAIWRATSAFDRAKIMRKAADILRSRVEDIARLMTLEEGKPLAESRIETLAAADIVDWFAEEGRRAYGRVIPARSAGVYQLVIKEPVGPVAAFTPWNFPINQIVRKLSAALAAGCSIIVKAPEETPASPAELIRAFVDAGLPCGVVGLVFGVPSQISEYLIPHPIIRKVTFTGSTLVGKKLAALAGAHMKRVTMELGGHAPVIVFDDADVEVAAKQISGAKFRNAGQVCVAPTRFLVQKNVYERFVERFVHAVKEIRVGNGLDDGVNMGPLANERRVTAMESLVADAVQKGAKIRTGGVRIGNKGNFFQPTVITSVDRTMRMMMEEPFGPLAMVLPFGDFDEAIAEANRLEYGLAAYAYTRSAKTANAVAACVETGMITINHLGLALPEAPFGGVKDSGYGSEGGVEGLDAYLTPKFVSQAGI